MELKIGDIFYDENGYKCHIVSLLKEESEPQIVYKYFGKHKQWWHYHIKSKFWFENAFEGGLYKLKRKI